ncbi:RNA-binding protein 44 isoform X3 [Hippoglossus stenolepis]|uniref:RNA-binding protein 44 isoform X3 n=1 Tax=Hippoglossus stenolepis TaxID=195615 RepID=UPI001FAFCE5D|nr:RNA-binding protein 44 isoform X3 [Hippoglossus stenolepis]
MATHQTVWPCFPVTFPCELLLPGQSYAANRYAGVAVHPRPIPVLYDAVIQKPCPKTYRKFLLQRSVFDLVEAHRYLSLTDQKLQGWYFGLTPEDRNIILDEGGFHQFLQRHSALELSTYHVYVKLDNRERIAPVQPTITCNQQISKTPGAKKCRCELPETQMRPNDVREKFTREPNEVLSHSKQLVHTACNSPITQRASSGTVCRDPAILVSFPLHMELEPSGQRGNPEPKSHISVMQDLNANVAANCAEVSELQSNPNESPSEHCSCDCVDVDAGEDSDRSIQSVVSEQVSCSLDPAEENSTEDEWQENTFSGADQNDYFHSIMGDDMSILGLVAPGGPQAHHSGPGATNSEALSDTGETATSPAEEDTSETCTPPQHRAPTCDVMVGTESVPHVSTFTQSEDPQTADKHVITEVHMADLDYLAGEFIKLNAAQKEQKEKIKRLGYKLRKGCDCIERAQQAELRLLAVQHLMCRQHCWRLCCTSAEGDQLITTHRDKDQYRPKEPPANISGVLQKLECDYNHMRDQILEGVPLEQLKPLCVDSEKSITGAGYVPAHIIGDVLEDRPSRNALEPQGYKTLAEENGCPGDQSSVGFQDRQTRDKKLKAENSKTRRVVTCVPQGGDANHDANKPEEKQTRAACKELNMSESWFDAEEDLQPAGAADRGQDTTTISEGPTDESPCEEAESSVLCVTNLPTNVTESEVKTWFEKYHPSEVIFPVLKKDLRVAIVTVTGLQSAEAAARELNGFSVKGRTLHVEHINRAVGGSQSLSQASGSIGESSQEAQTDPSSTERKLPLGSSTKSRTVVCIVPTAKATFVPQHYGTMGSFDTLMAALTLHHPAVGRQRIVNALVELTAKHRGALCGLPLGRIREMTSELLTRPENVP